MFFRLSVKYQQLIPSVSTPKKPTKAEATSPTPLASPLVKKIPLDSSRTKEKAPVYMTHYAFNLTSTRKHETMVEKFVPMDVVLLAPFSVSKKDPTPNKDEISIKRSLLHLSHMIGREFVGISQ
jgi:hypothetical protein